MRCPSLRVLVNAHIRKELYIISNPENACTFEVPTLFFCVNSISREELFMPRKDISVQLLLEKRERSYSFGEPRAGASDMLLNAPTLDAKPAALNTEANKIKDVIASFESLPLSKADSAH